MFRYEVSEASLTGLQAGRGFSVRTDAGCSLLKSRRRGSCQPPRVFYPYDTDAADTEPIITSTSAAAAAGDSITHHDDYLKPSPFCDYDHGEAVRVIDSHDCTVKYMYTNNYQ